MEIKVKHTPSFTHVCVVVGQTVIDLGLLDDSERNDLARTLLDAAFEMGPRYSNVCEALRKAIKVEWFAEMLERCGIELPNHHPLASTTAVSPR